MYEVGQVVFVISDKHKKVLPVRVVEQVVRRTLDGETVEYQVRGDNNKTQTYTLSSIGSQHFSSAEDVKRYMYKNATSQIDQIVGAALQAAITKYDYQEAIDGFVATPPTTTGSALNGQEDIFVKAGEDPLGGEDTRTRIKLPDGTYASVNVSIPGL